MTGQSIIFTVCLSFSRTAAIAHSPSGGRNPPMLLIFLLRAYLSSSVCGGKISSMFIVFLFELQQIYKCCGLLL